MEEVILFKIDIDVEKAQKDIVEYQIQLERLKQQKKEIEKANKEGLLSESEYAKKIIETQNAIKEVANAQKNAQKQIELATKVQQANKNSYQSLTLQYAEAKKKLNELADAFKINEDGSIELTEAYKEQAKIVEQLKSAIIEFDQNVKAGNTNVGNYTASFKKAIGEMKIFGVSVSNVQDGITKLTQGGLKGLISTLGGLIKTIATSPLGVLAIVFTAIAAAINKSKAAMGALEQAFAAFGQVFDAVFKVIEPAIKLFADGITFIANTISSLVSFFDKGAENASKLNGELQNINDELALQAGESEKLKIEAQKYKNIVEDTNKSIADRLEAAKKQFDTQVKSNEKILDLETQKLENLKKQLTTKGDTNKAFELQKEIAQQQQKVNALILEQEKAREELIKKTNELLREQKSDLVALQQANLNLAIAEGKIQKGSREELEAQKKILLDKQEIQLEGVEDATKRAIIEKTTQAEILNLEKEFAKTQAENAKKALEASKKLADERKKANEKTQDDLIKAEIARNETLLAQNELRTQQELQNVRKGSKEELEIVTKSNDEKLKIEAALSKARIEAIELRKKIELQNAQEAANELKKAGINASEFLKAERIRIEQETSKAITDEQTQLALKSLEIAKQQAEALKAIERESAKKALEQAVLDNQVKIEQQKRLGEQNVELLLEQAKTQNSLQNELLRQQLEAKEITEQEYEAKRLLALEQYYAQVKQIEEADLQRKTELELKKLELNKQVIASQFELADAITSLTAESEVAQKASFVFQKAVALAEVAINLQKELSLIASNPGLNADPTQTAKIIAISAAIARGIKIIASIKNAQFAEGGFTGEGHKYEVAGIVHKGEYVVPKWQVESKKYAPLISLLEIGRLKGYATGGLVGNGSIVTSGQEEILRIQAEVLKNMPPPVVDVREVVTVSERVKAIENLSSF